MDVIGTHDPRLIAIAVVTLFVCIANVLLFRKRSFPPGPPGLPFIGNIFDIPKKEAWKTYVEWGKQYSKLQLSFFVA